MNKETIEEIKEIKFPNDNEVELVINSKFYKLISLIAEKEDLNNSHQDWSDVRFAQMYQRGFKDGVEWLKNELKAESIAHEK